MFLLHIETLTFLKKSFSRNRKSLKRFELSQGFVGVAKIRMTRLRAGFLLVLMLVILAPSIFLPSSLVSHAASSVHSGYELVNSEQFTSYGQFIVNDTLLTNASTTQSLSQVTFGFPLNYSGNIYSESAGYYIGSTHYSATVSYSILNKTLLVSLALSPAIPAGTSANVSLGFYVLNTYTAQTTTNYLVPMLFYPSVSVPLDNLSSTLRFPSQTTAPVVNSINPYGFTTIFGTSVLTWSYTSNNVTATSPHWAAVTLNSTSTDSGYIDFQSIQRLITMDAEGNVIVQDTITVKNLGLNTLTNLQVNFLTNATTVTVEPTKEPPLSNVQTMTLVGGEMDLSGINRVVEPNSAVSVIVQYNLGAQYWNYSNGVYDVKIPTTVPVNALVDQFSINYNIPSDYIALSTPPNLSLTNTVGNQGYSILSYRMGVGSAIGYAMPAGGLVFIGVFLAVLVLRSNEDGQEDFESTLDSMVKSIEEKVSGTNDILSELKNKGEAAARNDLLSTRSRIEELRSKTAGRFNSLRSQLGAASVEEQETMNTVLSNDREFDRAVKDLLNNYDQLLSKKMKVDTFARVQQNNERRIQHLANALLDSLHDLGREYEQ